MTNGAVRQICRAVGLLVFWITTKLYLFVWYRQTTEVDPLATVPDNSVWLLAGSDAIVSLAIATGYIAIWAFALKAFSSRTALRVTESVTLVAHTSLVVFTVVSLKVNQVYGAPLDIEHIRDAGNLYTLRDSIWAHADLASVSLLVLGVGSFWLLPASVLAKALFPVRHAAMAVAVFTFGSMGYGFASYTQLKAVYTFGLKQNPALFFVRTYGSVLTMSDLEEQRRQIAAADRDDATYWQSLSPRKLATPPPPPQTHPADQAALPNVLVIILESTAAQHLSEASAPNVMRIAKEGVSFTNYYTTAANSYQARYSTWFSDYIGKIPARDVYCGPMPQHSIFDVTAAAGYENALFHSGYHSYTDLAFFWDHKPMVHLVDAELLRSQNANPTWAMGVFEEETIDATLAWIDNDSSVPKFTVYSPIAGHHPYYSPSEKKPFPQNTPLGQHRNALYYVDQQVGRLLSYLAESATLDDTLIVVTADHGESVSGQLAGHGLATSDEELRVPFILRHPGLLPRPEQNERVSNHLDFAPTLASLLGAPTVDDWKGRNLFARNLEPRMFHVATNHAREDAIIDGDHVYRLSQATKKRALFRVAPDRTFVPVRLKESEQSILEVYTSQVQHFQNWATWSHVQRSACTHNFVN